MNYKNKFIFALAVLYATLQPPSAAQAAFMTLSDCIALALRENRTIKNAYLDRVSQKYDLRVAEDKFTPKLQITPQITASGSNSASDTTTKSETAVTVKNMLPTGASVTLSGDYGLTSSEQSTPEKSYGWSVSVSQPLLKNGGLDVNLASVRTARLNEQGNILSLKSTLTDTLVSVISAYRSYVQNIKSLDIARQSLERSKELLATNRELIAAGRMAAIEIIQSEADVANREFNLLSAENTVDAARLALTKAIDIDKNSQITPVTETTITAVPYTMEQALKLALANRPDYQRSLLSYQVAKINLATIKNSTLWDLSLTGSYSEKNTAGSGSAGSTGGMSGAWNAGLVLTVPIGDLSIRQAYISAEINMKKTENDLARQRENIELEVQDAIRSAEMSYRQIKLAQLSRQLSEKKVEIETEKLKAGRSTNFQLVSFQNDLVSAQNGELNAVIGYLNSLTTLESKLGITLERLGVTLAER